MTNARYQIVSTTIDDDTLLFYDKRGLHLAIDGPASFMSGGTELAAITRQGHILNLKFQRGDETTFVWGRLAPEYLENVLTYCGRFNAPLCVFDGRSRQKDLWPLILTPTQHLHLRTATLGCLDLVTS